MRQEGGEQAAEREFQASGADDVEAVRERSLRFDRSVQAEQEEEELGGVDTVVWICWIEACIILLTRYLYIFERIFLSSLTESRFPQLNLLLPQTPG
jgi:hypothetical protein